MVVFAANITEDTVNLIESFLKSDEFVRFSLQNKLNLSDKTILIRLALINLTKNIPTNDEVTSYKAALLRPQEFDDYWKNQIEGEIVGT